VLQDRRRGLHVRIVDAIEALYPERLTEQVERLAHHAFRGELWEKAVTYLRHAGAKAFARSANREAVVYFQQALAALTHLPETREMLERAVDLRFDLRTALFALGEFESIVGYLREADNLARKLDDQRRLGRMSVYMCHNLWVTGHPTEAVMFGRSAHAIAETLGDFPLQIGAQIYLGAAYFASGDYRQAEEPLRKVVQALEGEPGRERLGLAGFPAAMVRFYLASVLAERGEFEEGIAHGEEGIHLAEVLDHPYSVTAMCWALAYLYSIRGDFHHAVRLLERGLVLARDWNLTFWSAIATGGLGHVYALSGHVAEGFPLLRHARQTLESMGMTRFSSLVLRYLGEAGLLAHRLEDATDLAGRVMTLARERGQRGYQAWALRLLSEIASHREPLEAETADEHYRQALADELGMRPLVAHCHLGLGMLYHRTGDRANAEEHLTTAATMYREMKMDFWRAKAEAGPDRPRGTRT
jgi:tetratricopeptide (TPR) repeat protein